MCLEIADEILPNFLIVFCIFTYWLMLTDDPEIKQIGHKSNLSGRFSQHGDVWSSGLCQRSWTCTRTCTSTLTHIWPKIRPCHRTRSFVSSSTQRGLHFRKNGLQLSVVELQPVLSVRQPCTHTHTHTHTLTMLYTHHYKEAWLNTLPNLRIFVEMSKRNLPPTFLTLGRHTVYHPFPKLCPH